jgi:type I restriction enzyme S subunit
MSMVIPYPEYRDSGVEWLAKVPTQWNIIRLKYGVSLINDKVENGESDTPYLGLENVESWTGRIIETDFKPEIEGASNSFRKDDVLFGKLRPYLAKAVHAQYHGICTSELMVLRPQKYYSRFLFYYMLSPSTVNIIDSSTYGVKMPRANWHFIGNLPVVVPPISEQQAIADFLDREATKIDELITKKQRLIELLQEQRTALISHAITKGINPDTTMKDSGVEWMGEIPAHWDIKKIKYVLGLYSGESPPASKNNDEGLYPIFGANGIIGACNSKNLTRRTIVIGRVGASGEVNISPPECWVTDNVLIVKMKQLIEFNYGFYFLKSLKLNELALKNAQPLITGSFIKNIIIGIPPIQEQQAIADFLDYETARIDSLISRINQAVEKLQEYRTGLITVAVTGKIDVRQHVS